MQMQPVSRDLEFYCDGYDRRRVNIAQACEIAAVTRRTIYNWMALGKIEFVRTAGGQVRIFADTLLVRGPEAE